MLLRFVALIAGLTLGTVVYVGSQPPMRSVTLNFPDGEAASGIAVRWLSLQQGVGEAEEFAPGRYRVPKGARFLEARSASAMGESAASCLIRLHDGESGYEVRERCGIEFEVGWHSSLVGSEASTTVALIPLSSGRPQASAAAKAFNEAHSPPGAETVRALFGERELDRSALEGATQVLQADGAGWQLTGWVPADLDQVCRPSVPDPAALDFSGLHFVHFADLPEGETMRAILLETNGPVRSEYLAADGSALGTTASEPFEIHPFVMIHCFGPADSYRPYPRILMRPQGAALEGAQR